MAPIIVAPVTITPRQSEVVCIMVAPMTMTIDRTPRQEKAGSEMGARMTPRQSCVYDGSTYDYDPEAR